MQKSLKYLKFFDFFRIIHDLEILCYHENMKYTISQHKITRDDKQIYGELYAPEKTPFPLLIVSHGLGGNLEGSRDIAEAAGEAGIGVFIFDFCGGSEASRSDGKITEMSVQTEAADLRAILDTLKKDPAVDKDHIFLAGKSQGALVSTIVASENPQEIHGLIGLYSGFFLNEFAQNYKQEHETIPETLEVLWFTVGRIYIEDMLKADLYERMKKYDSDVLLIHGTNDAVASLSSAIIATDYFPHCEFVTLEGAEHGFHGPERPQVVRMIIEFIQNHL